MYVHLMLFKLSVKTKFNGTLISHWIFKNTSVILIYNVEKAFTAVVSFEIQRFVFNPGTKPFNVQ